MIDFKNIRKNTFRIGEFRVEPTRNLLKKNGQTFPLEPKIMDVLCELASFPGEVIARYDLIQRIWKVDYGADESLTRAISVLRKTFRKGGAADKYIETISKNGYRLIAPVSAWEDDGSRAVAQPAKAAAPSKSTVTTVPKIQTVQMGQPKLKLERMPEARKSAVATTPILTTRQPSSALASQPKSTPNIFLAATTIALLTLIGISIPFAKGYWDAHTDDFKTEISELRDLSTVNPGALDSVDPISVSEPFRGDVSGSLKDYGRSAAVLPFKDMSADGTKRYFADGMAEEILLKLSAIDGLRIIGRAGAVKPVQDGMDLRAIGDTLQVSHLIDGSVRTMNGRVRVSVQLIDPASQTQIWGQSYDGALKDGLNLQSKIASDIVEELNILLALNEDETLEFNLEGFAPTAKRSTVISILPQQQVKSATAKNSGIRQQEEDIAEMIKELELALSGSLDSPLPFAPIDDLNEH